MIKIQVLVVGLCACKWGLDNVYQTVVSVMILVVINVNVKGIDPAIKSLNVFKKFFLEYDYTHSFTKIKAKIGGQYASFRTTVYLT